MTANIHVKIVENAGAVVNCFQKFVSLWRRTSTASKGAHTTWLWIAFKNLYLCDGEHPISITGSASESCELLSKICIFVTANIYNPQKVCVMTVVNCFQKFVSLWRRTSYFHVSKAKFGCELLSKICIFVTANITLPPLDKPYMVVNCFQKFVSLWRRTSYCSNQNLGSKLWIAFKNLYLCDGEHLRRRQC